MKSKISIVLTFLLLITFFHFSIVASEPYKEELEVIDKMTAFEKKAVVIFIRGYFNSRYEKVAINNFSDKFDKDTFWVMMIFSSGNYHMSIIAKHVGWKEMENYYLAEAENMNQHINGKISRGKFIELSKENELILHNLLEKEKPEMDKYKKVLAENEKFISSLSESIMGQAKYVATKGLK